MIPFIDLQAQKRRVETEARRRMDAVLEHGRFVMGPEVDELEKRLAEYVGVEHAVSCASGTDALLMPLMALDIGPGDAVLTTPFTFIATAEVISLLGATPVFVDIDPVTFNIDPDKLEAAIRAVEQNDSSIHTLPPNAGKLTAKAVIPVDLFGQAADYDRILPLCEKHGVAVIEDAAQSFGGRLGDRRCGSFGLCGATSFFPAKPLGCWGDGGAVFTDDAELAEKLTSVRVHGQGRDKYENVRVGINGRLDTLQAAVLLAKLDIFDDEIEARQKVAAAYAKGMAGLEGVVTPTVPENMLSAWAQYSLLTPGPQAREGLMAHLKEAGVPSVIYYPKPLHMQTAYAGLGYGEGDFPISEGVSRRIMSLPMHPYLEDGQIETICQAVRQGAENFA
ncbi:DegT/DnrJ/EryC1/StrS family aminotransferase [Desulfohalovibrio reitneri]|uniref:DegT/DnrJ/EryC1/StrS family aminotransferase n=1 Tax=Desulfohalovibrio reitneri TaxID=1307759 RepID=UPI0004A6D13F|nr:DegT/DnrJ/EryC1/StrS family aminotransferase [Desulfohalovibrio reitneri]